MAYYQKHRPQKFSHLVGQGHISGTLSEAIKRDRLSHAYIFTGPRGTGKTTTARLLAKAINCLKAQESGEPCGECPSCLAITQGSALDVIEIDAASHTSVDDVRDLIDKARLVPTQLPKKVYIIDEVHMLSKSAFNALLKTLEEPPTHVVFILATTEVHKLPETILSRAQRYDFKLVSAPEITAYLGEIAKVEDLKIEPEALSTIAALARGGLRDALSLLEQVGNYATEVTLKDVEEILGVVPQVQVESYVRHLLASQTDQAIKLIHTLTDQGYDLAIFYRDVLDLLRQVMLCHYDKAASSSTVKDLAQGVEPVKLIGLFKILMDRGKLFKEFASPVLPLEMATIEAIELLGLSKKQVAVKEEIVQSSVTERRKEKIEVDVPKVESTPPVPASRPKKPETDDIVSKATVWEMTGDLWEKIVAKAKAKNATLGALLRDTKPLEVTPEAVVLGVKFQFHRDKLTEPKISAILETVIKEITGSNCKIKCELASARRTTRSEPVKAEELEQVVGEVFEIAG